MSWLSELGRFVKRELGGGNPDPRFQIPQGGPAAGPSAGGGPGGTPGQFVPRGFQIGPAGGDGRNVNGTPFMGGGPNPNILGAYGPSLAPDPEIGYTSKGYGYARKAPRFSKTPAPTETGNAPPPASNIVKRALGYFTDPEQGAQRTYLASQLVGGVADVYGAYQQGKIADDERHRLDEERRRRREAWGSLG